jgi:hypothetical protein
VFEPKPDVTFDSFLEPHASGTGEAYRGTENAKKGEQPGTEEGSIELKLVDPQTKRSTHRMGKMPSMPSLSVRKKRSESNSPVSQPRHQANSGVP